MAEGIKLTQGEVSKILGFSSTRSFNKKAKERGVLILRGRPSSKNDFLKPSKEWVYRPSWFLNNPTLGINVKDYRGDWTPYFHKSQLSLLEKLLK